MFSYSTYTDAALLELLKNADEAAFQELFTRYWQPLYEKTNSILNNPHAAKDILQDVFFSLWNRRREVEISSLKGWLEQAVRFQVFKAIREKKAGAALQHKLSEVTADILEDDPLLFKEHQQLLAYLIGRLPEDCREVFRLSRQEELTYKEIGLRLNIPEKTVERKIAKSLAFFRSNFRYEIGIYFLIAGLITNS